MGEVRYANWQEVTVPELEAFFGCMILMGLVKLSALADYWSKSPIFHYAPIASRIPRDRFFEIQRYLHFTDNSLLAATGSPAYNKLGKIEAIVNMVTNKFRSIYNLHKEVSVDEAMIPFKGRSSLKQYLPKKPVRRGIKVWVLADSITGYASALEVYKGKAGNGKAETGLGAAVVKRLCQDIKER